MAKRVKAIKLDAYGRAYEKGFADGIHDGFVDAATKVLPALQLALDRLELSDYDGDEAESMAAVQKAIAELEPFVTPLK